MLGCALAAIHTGLLPEICRVEADVSGGFPRFSIVGLPDSAVRESKLRIRSAFHNSMLTFPQGRITVNLTPANFRKQGSGLDLAIAVAILRASGQIPPDDGSSAFLAELQLSGKLAPVHHAVSLALKLADSGVARLIIADDQVIPKELESVITCIPAIHLAQCVEGCRSSWTQRLSGAFGKKTICQTDSPRQDKLPSFDSIHGRSHEKRILSIAAAGEHPLLLLGPPGIGKTLLASHLTSLLPELDDHEALACLGRSESREAEPVRLIHKPPVRAPHHSITTAGLIGGGSPPRPGEVTLAHNGVLLLDELFEFRRAVLDALRGPLLEGVVHLSRAGNSVTLPSRFLLVATANPCPCGYRGYQECRCLDSDVRRYLSRCSGPLLDRIDLLVYMDRQEFNVASGDGACQLDALQKQVLTARNILDEWRHQQGDAANVTLQLTGPAKVLFERCQGAIVKSERSSNQLLRIAQTIAALDGRTQIREADLEEAIQPVNNRLRFGK